MLSILGSERGGADPATLATGDEGRAGRGLHAIRDALQAERDTALALRADELEHGDARCCEDRIGSH